MASSADNSVPCAEQEKKTSWPELVGKNGQVAAEIIKKEDPTLDVIVLLEGSPTTKDLRMDRVRIFVGADENVVRTPKTG